MKSLGKKVYKTAYKNGFLLTKVEEFFFIMNFLLPRREARTANKSIAASGAGLLWKKQIKFLFFYAAILVLST